MATMFAQKGWALDPERPIQGLWLRLCVERPCGTHGWVPVLDGAFFRDEDTIRQPWWDPIMAAAIAPSNIAIPRNSDDTTLWNNPASWALGKVRTRNHLAHGLSPYAQRWVGPQAVRGWPQDTILAVATFTNINATDAIGLRMVRKVLTLLQDMGNPYGQGWGLAEATSGREPDRMARSLPAHAHLTAARTYGPPQAWDVQTMRVHAALTAYVHHNGPRGPGAWMA